MKYKQQEEGMTIELTQQQAFIARLMLTKDEVLKKMVKHILSGAGLVLADNNYLTRDNAEELLAAYDAKWCVVDRIALTSLVGTADAMQELLLERDGYTSVSLDYAIDVAKEALGVIEK